MSVLSVLSGAALPRDLRITNEITGICLTRGYDCRNVLSMENTSIDFTTPGFDPDDLTPIHELPAEAAAEAWEEDRDNYPDFDPWAEAMLVQYDDDPNPYHGDYSEM